ncbi:lig_chan-Glu_bd domain-containing protein [Caerostris extrusa]|uniref:Lig_chan-Glu_bd domain-containing protein n=1 Tax=Caerostris extrusa TaxID=172846 RepID=A0AAV4XXW7_CAEEX|nr:lig_chan-Glu_bd domain-containing protein [Caerostris extrusa]
MVYRNASDIGLGYLSVTTNRSEVVDFIPYSIEEENTFASSLPPILSPVSEYTYPFEKRKLLAAFSGKILTFVLEMWGYVSYGQLAHFRCDFIVLLRRMLLSSVSVPLRGKGIRTIKKLSEAVSDGKYKCFSSIVALCL